MWKKQTNSNKKKKTKIIKQSKRNDHARDRK